eukprot:g4226.t1
MAGRFSHPWWRRFDNPTDGYYDSAGFMNRLPLRLESREAMVYGLVDPAAMWKDYEDEEFIPILVGGKAVVSIWFNDFKDTDCGGSYLETWYNTFVTTKDNPLELPYESPMSCLIEHPDCLTFLQRVVCGDAPGNRGAALKAITGGREIFGFPKHPIPGNIRFSVVDGGTATHFDATHRGQHVVSLRMKLPEATEGHVSVPLDVETGPTAVIGAPRLGGTHLGHNGANQMRFGQALCCTQHVCMWDPAVDTLILGDDAHYAAPLKRWSFEPLVKVSSNDFKIAAYKPAGWKDGAAAAAAVAEHERQVQAGTKPGLVLTPSPVSATIETAETTETTETTEEQLRVHNPEYRPTGLEGFVDTAQMSWVPAGSHLPGVAQKILRVSAETGQFSLIRRAPKGTVLPPFVHIASCDFYVLEGRLAYPGGAVQAGGWMFKAAGSLHHQAVAAEDTVFLMNAHGPIAFLAPEGEHNEEEEEEGRGGGWRCARIESWMNVATTADELGMPTLPSTLSEAIAAQKGAIPMGQAASGGGGGGGGGGTAPSAQTEEEKAAIAAAAVAVARAHGGDASGGLEGFVDTEAVPWIDIVEAPGNQMKILRVSEQTGSWTVLIRASAGTVNPPHVHLGSSDFLVLDGKIGYRAGPPEGLGPGSWFFEPAGAEHESTTAITQLTYLANVHGPIQFHGEDGVSIAAVQSWMQMKQAVDALGITPASNTTAAPFAARL